MQIITLYEKSHLLFRSASKILKKSIIIRYPYSTYALTIRVAHTPRLSVQYIRLGSPCSAHASV